MQRLSRGSVLPLCLLAVTISGAAGLIYQVAWTRRLASVTSATAPAQALVLAVFMAGLSLGAYGAGRISHRLRRPLVGYALVELSAAALAVLSFPLIDASNGVRSALISLGGPAGLYAQLAVISLLLLGPTILLGASLPLVIAHAVSDGRDARSSRGRGVSVLYGLNTVGAAAGCWLAGFVAIERLGLSHTALAGAAFGIAAASTAGLAQVLASQGRSTGSTRSTLPRAPLGSRFIAAAFLSGLVGLGAEVLWTRLLALIVPNTVYAFSQVLVAVLIGIALGTAVAGALARRLERATDVAAEATDAAALLAALGAVCFAAVPLAVVWLASAHELQNELASGTSARAAAIILFCFVPPSALIASALPLLVTAARSARCSEAFGVLYASNTVGSVLGSLLVGFALLPLLGARGAGAVLELGCLVLALALLGSRAHRWRSVLALAAVTCAVLHFSHDVPHQIYANRLPPGTEVLEFREGAESHVMVTQNSEHRLLWINSSWVATSYGGHRVIGHLPALLVEQPKRVLGIALGTGQTFAAVLAHGAEHFDCVEIDAGVIELSRRWFSVLNGGVLDDPRVTVHKDDGRAFLRAGEDRYDLIVLEPLQAWSVGTSNLYSREFYQEAARRMNPGAVLAQWIPLYGQAPDETRALVRTGLEVFAQGSLWVVGNEGVLILSNDPFELSLAALEQRIGERGLAEELRRFPVEVAADLTAALLLGPEGLRGWTAGAEILEDDRPFLEFRAAHEFTKADASDRVRTILRTAQPHLDELSRYVRTSGEERAQLETAGRVRAARLAVRLVAPSQFARRAAILESVLPAGADSAVWRALYARLVERWAAAPETRAAGPAAAEEIYRRALTLAPDLPIRPDLKVRN